MNIVKFICLAVLVASLAVWVRSIANEKGKVSTVEHLSLAIDSPQTTGKLNRSVPIVSGMTPVKNEPNKMQLNSTTEALSIITDVFAQVINGQAIEIKSERQLLQYLRSTDDELVYQFIIDRLNNSQLTSQSNERLYEYALSLLAAIDTQRASELFFSTITTNRINGSSAIYSAKKSIERLSRTSDYTGLTQQAFSNSDKESRYLGDLANAIAKNADAHHIDFLMSYIEKPQSSKQQAAARSMRYIQKESLVPVLSSYIANENVKSNVQDAALDALANMGQYEAASALIKWSAKQPSNSIKQVTSLFNVAIQRSPSSSRAIEKEVHLTEFVSDKIKNKITELAK